MLRDIGGRRPLPLRPMQLIRGCTMRRLVKHLYLRAVTCSPVFERIRYSRWRQRRLAILCYHGVAGDDEHRWNPALYMSRAAFEGRLRLLEAGAYVVLPFGEAIERLYSGTLPPRSVALTFDDGYSDFGRIVHPLLQARGLVATVYLPTLRCKHNSPQFRLLTSYMLWRRRGSVFSSLLHGRPARMDLRTQAGRAEALSGVLRVAEGMSLKAKDDLAQELARVLGLDYEQIVGAGTLRLLGPDEVAHLSAAGVDFELHTHSHQILRDREHLRAEIHRNREYLKALTGRNPRHFCYPSGIYRREFLPWLAQEGIRTATTCDAGLASRRSRPLLLPRIVDTSGLSAVEFEARLAGADCFLPPWFRGRPAGRVGT